MQMSSLMIPLASDGGNSGEDMQTMRANSMALLEPGGTPSPVSHEDCVPDPRACEVVETAREFVE